MLSLAGNYEEDVGVIYGEVTARKGTGGQWRM